MRCQEALLRAIMRELAREDTEDASLYPSSLLNHTGDRMITDEPLFRSFFWSSPGTIESPMAILSHAPVCDPNIMLRM